ncbi:Protein of unknown function [Gryllus bimaculatus]|nr:Protein of unknown function [Gryllus bimaculatus]
MLAADNAISQWAADAFSPHVVITLDLRRNRLTAIGGDMLRALRNQWGLRHLLLQGNPLSCDPCKVRDFARWVNAQANLDRQHVRELTCGSGGKRTPLLETSVDCKEPTWLLELFLPVCAFLVLGGVFYVIWLVWRKELTYMMKIAHLRPIVVWPGYFTRNR